MEGGGAQYVKAAAPPTRGKSEWLPPIVAATTAPSQPEHLVSERVVPGAGRVFGALVVERRLVEGVERRG